jgi:membrane protein
VHNAAALVPAFLISIALMAAQRGYQLYTSKVLTYNKIYGSLAAVPIILFWIYILWALVLFGAALSSAVHRRLESP